MPDSDLSTTSSNIIRNSILASLRLWLGIGDLVAATIALTLAIWLTALTASEPFSPVVWFNRPLWIYGLIPGWWLMLQSVYDERKITQRSTVLRSLALVAVVSLGLYVSVFFVVQPALLPRLVILYFISLNFLVTGLWRVAFILIRVNRQRRIIIVGAGRSGRLLVNAIEALDPKPYVIVGLLDDDPTLHGQAIGACSVLGDHRRLLSLAQAERVSVVVLAVRGTLEGGLIQAITDCGESGIDVIRFSTLYEQITGRVPIYHLDADWIVTSLAHTQSSFSLRRVAMKVFDLAASLVGLFLLIIIFIPVALAIHLDSAGPIFYSQTRSGRGGKPFTLYKFRSMLPNAEPEGTPRWTEPDDERVTRVGAILRRARIDEIPQFLNVLKGDMSLIGPRPERPEFTSMLETRIPFYRARLLVKPGITGWAQVNYGYAASVDRTALKLEYDLYYIKEHSLMLDLLIIWRTFITLVQLQGT